MTETAGTAAGVEVEEVAEMAAESAAGAGSGAAAAAVEMAAETVTIQTTAEAFVRALQESLKPERKVGIPALQYAKVGSGTVTVTDLEITTVVPFAEAGEADGAAGAGGCVAGNGGSSEFLVPYHQTLNVLAGESGPLAIVYQPSATANAAAAQVTYRLQDCEYTFESLDIERFPQTPEFPGVSGQPGQPGQSGLGQSGQSVEIGAVGFRQLIDRTLFAVSKEDTRYMIQGALLKVAMGKAVMVGTDGFRLAVAQTASGASGARELSMLIPRATLSYLQARVKEAKAGAKAAAEGKVVIQADSTGQFQFFYLSSADGADGGIVQVASRALAGRFPNYEAVLPRDDERTIRAEIASAKGLLPVLARVAKCSDERSGAVRLEFGQGEGKGEGKGLGLSASSVEGGAARASFPCVATEAVTVGLNHKYLAEFLKVVGDKPVQVSLRDGDSAVKFSVDGWEYVVMPIRM